MKKSHAITTTISVISFILLILIVVLGTNKDKFEYNKNKELSTTYLKNEQKVITTVQVKKTNFYSDQYLQLLKEKKDNKGILFGDSIAISSGISDDKNKIDTSIGNNLFTKYSLGTAKDWSPSNLGISGGTIVDVATYISSYQDKNGQVVNSTVFSKPYWIIMVGLNDSKKLNIDTFSKLYRMVVRKGINSNIDVYCVTQPPSIDIKTGEIVNSNYPSFKAEIQKIATEEGSIFVDVYSKWLELKTVDNKLTKYYKDGILPNDEGNSKITELIVSAMLSEKKPKTASKPDEYSVLAQFTPDTVQNAKLIPTSSLSPNLNTSRSSFLDTKDVFEISNGGKMFLSMPQGKLTDLIVSMVNKKGSGTINIDSASSNFNKLSLKANDDDSFKQNSYIIKLLKQNTTFTKDFRINSTGTTYFSGLYGIYNN